MGRGAGDGAISWGQVSHAYGPAVEVPGWIAGLRDPGTAAQCLSELYGSITHQGSRYSATPLCVPLLVDAALDRSVVDRAGVVFLAGFCAVGYSRDWLDWRNQRRVQTGPFERASWDAVVAEHGRLRELLADLDRSVAAAALTVLAWTGDGSDRMLAAIAAAAESDDGRDQCTAWLSSVVLGQLPPGLAVPASLAAPAGPGRFGAAVAALEFGGASAPLEAVDELCSVFASIHAGKDLTGCEFLMPEDPGRIAASALADVPPAGAHQHTAADRHRGGFRARDRSPARVPAAPPRRVPPAREGGLLASPDATGTDQPARTPRQLARHSHHRRPDLRTRRTRPARNARPAHPVAHASRVLKTATPVRHYNSRRPRYPGAVEISPEPPAVAPPVIEGIGR